MLRVAELEYTRTMQTLGALRALLSSARGESGRQIKDDNYASTGAKRIGKRCALPHRLRSCRSIAPRSPSVYHALDWPRAESQWLRGMRHSFLRHSLRLCTALPSLFTIAACGSDKTEATSSSPPLDASSETAVDAPALDAIPDETAWCINRLRRARGRRHDREPAHRRAFRDTGRQVERLRRYDPGGLVGHRPVALSRQTGSHRPLVAARRHGRHYRHVRRLWWRLNTVDCDRAAFVARSDLGPWVGTRGTGSARVFACQAMADPAAIR